MDDKIAVGAFASAMAQATGKSKKLCEDFIREFFKLAAESLLDGEALKIKGLGTFKVSEVESRSGINVNTGKPQIIPPHKKVVFTPAKELASAINAPFEDFESVEIDDEMPDLLFPEVPETDTTIPIDSSPSQENIQSSEGESLNHETEDDIEGNEEENPDSEDDVEEGIIEAGSDEEAEDDEITAEAYETLENEEEADGASQIPTPESSNVPVPDSQIPAPEEEYVLPAENNEPPHDTIEQDYDYEYDQPQSRSRFWLGFLVGSLSSVLVCVVVFMLGCFFDWWPVNFEWVKELYPREQAIATQPLEEQPEAVAPATAVPEIVVDTVSTTRYLTTIAREHYGEFNFWPYIYLANDSILGHPDRITPGTVVVVPDLDQLGIKDPKDKGEVDKAKEMGAEIYARFR